MSKHPFTGFFQGITPVASERHSTKRRPCRDDKPYMCVCRHGPHAICRGGGAEEGGCEGKWWVE